jgi:hypothetical protein
MQQLQNQNVVLLKNDLKVNVLNKQLKNKYQQRHETHENL